MKIQSSVIRDKFEFTDTDGNVIKEIPFTINATALNDSVAQARIKFAQASSENDPHAMTETCVMLYETIFGKAVTDELRAFYDNDILTLMVDTAPYLVDRVFPLFDRLRVNAINLRKKAKRE
jgi:hypothetical protein